MVFVLVHAAQVEVWIAASFVAFRTRSFLKPGDSLLPFSLFNQIGPDIVVRIAELGIHLDCFKTFSDGLVVIAEERICPATECVGLSGGEGLDGAGVELNSLLVFSRHLLLVGLAEIGGGSGARIGFEHSKTYDKLEEILSEILGHALHRRIVHLAGRDDLGAAGSAPTYFRHLTAADFGRGLTTF